MIFDSLISTVIDEGKKILGNVLGVNSTGNEVSKAQAELELAIRKIDFSTLEKDLQDKADARALALAESKSDSKYIKFMRPTWGYGLFVLFAFRIVSPVFGIVLPSMSAYEVTVFVTVISFYFGGRTAEKMMRISNGRKK